MVVVFIKYRINPQMIDLFDTYSRNWLKIIPKCGG